MVNKFSPSVNICRDQDVELDYLPTSNAKLVYSHIVNSCQTGERSFIINGNYGTGKSSFLWAFEKNLNNKQPFFEENSSPQGGAVTYEVLPFVGDYISIVDVFATFLHVDKSTSSIVKNIFKKLDRYSSTLKKEGKGLLIILDEFGKFLEYATDHNPEFEVYFIQQLAEYSNDTKKNILLLTTLHQGFSAYSLKLSKPQRQEWDKVKGRFKEISFNEPVEQLLLLASERLNGEKTSELHSNFLALFHAIQNSRAFPLRDYLKEEYAEKLLPFDILAASALTLALQKYGQNERSLFSFINSNDYLGINAINHKENPYYNLCNVYDYLIHNYFSFISSKFNPHYSQWAAIRIALERAEGVVGEDIESVFKLLKTIGLLNVFASASARIDLDFLCLYGKYSLGINNTKKNLKKLEGFKIIRFVSHRSTYVLFEGTDLDIELEFTKQVTLSSR